MKNCSSFKEINELNEEAAVSATKHMKNNYKTREMNNENNKISGNFLLKCVHCKE